MESLSNLVLSHDSSAGADNIIENAWQVNRFLSQFTCYLTNKTMDYGLWTEKILCITLRYSISVKKFIDW